MLIICFIEFKVGNWSKKNLLALFCIVCQYVICTGTTSNTSVYQSQSVTAKLLMIQGHIIMRDNALYKCATDECNISYHSSNRIGYF